MVGRDEVMLRKQRLELPPEEEVDPTQQDRRHAGRLEAHADAYKAGLEHIRAGRYFEAHEELELAWRGGGSGGARLLPGARARGRRLVPGRPRQPVGAARQLEKGLRRLEPFEPAHRGVDVAGVRRQLRAPQALVGRGSLERRRLGSRGREPDPSSVRFSATWSHQSRWKKRSRPSATRTRR